MITILYFSPTGNVAYGARKLSLSLKELDPRVLALEETDPSELKPADHLVLMYSIHGFNPPRTVNRFVGNIPENLYNNVSILSFGCAESWVNEAASSGLRKTFRNKGYELLVDLVLAMPLTFIMSFPKDYARNLVQTMDEKIPEIAELIRNGVKTEKEIPFKSRMVHFIGKAEGPASRLFGLELRAGKTCTSCGLCVKRCPEKNIRFNRKNKPVFGLSCLMCMRCIYSCPEKAIKPLFSRFIPIKEGYDLSEFT